MFVHAERIEATRMYVVYDRQRHLSYFYPGVVELADTRDLKSLDSMVVQVQPLSSGPFFIAGWCSGCTSAS